MTSYIKTKEFNEIVLFFILLSYLVVGFMLLCYFLGLFISTEREVFKDVIGHLAKFPLRIVGSLLRSLKKKIWFPDLFHIEIPEDLYKNKTK